MLAKGLLQIKSGGIHACCAEVAARQVVESILQLGLCSRHS